MYRICRVDLQSFNIVFVEWSHDVFVLYLQSEAVMFLYCICRVKPWCFCIVFAEWNRDVFVLYLQSETVMLLYCICRVKPWCFCVVFAEWNRDVFVLYFQDGKDEKTKKKEQDENGARLIDYAKAYTVFNNIASGNVKAIEKGKPKDKGKPKKDKEKKNGKEKTEKRTKKSDKSNGKGETKTQVKPQSTKESEKLKKKGKETDKSDSAKKEDSLTSSEVDTTLWSYVRELYTKDYESKSSRGTPEQATRLANYLEMMLEKCRSKSHKHLVAEAKHLVQALVVSTVYVPCFLRLYFFIAAQIAQIVRPIWTSAGQFGLSGHITPQSTWSAFIYGTVMMSPASLEYVL